jgi:hypothetical protein
MLSASPGLRNIGPVDANREGGCRHHHIPAEHSRRSKINIQFRCSSIFIIFVKVNLFFYLGWIWNDLDHSHGSEAGLFFDFVETREGRNLKGGWLLPLAGATATAIRSS